MRKGDAFVLQGTYPICHWTGTPRPQAARGRQAKPGRILHHRCPADAPSRALAAGVQPRLPQPARQGAAADRLLHSRARGVFVDGLLRHDRTGAAGDPSAGERGAPPRPGAVPGARLSVPDDRRQPGKARGQPVGGILARSQGRLRCLRADAAAAAREPVRAALCRDGGGRAGADRWTADAHRRAQGCGRGARPVDLPHRAGAPAIGRARGRGSRSRARRRKRPHPRAAEAGRPRAVLPGRARARGRHVIRIATQTSRRGEAGPDGQAAPRPPGGAGRNVPPGSSEFPRTLRGLVPACGRRP